MIEQKNFINKLMDISRQMAFGNNTRTMLHI